MQTTAVLSLALAMALMPVVSALPQEADAPGLGSVLPVAPTAVADASIDAQAGVSTDGTNVPAGEVSIGVGPALTVHATTGPDAGVTATAVPSPSPVAPASFADRAYTAIAPAVAPAGFALAVGTLAFGAGGLRGLGLRIVARSGRGLRAFGSLVFGLPLFSRILHGSVLDNPVRARIHEAVLQDPGLTLSEVVARAGVAWGTAVHHLRRLEAHGLLVSTQELGHHRYFVANTAAASQRSAMAVVMHPTARRIAEVVAQRPGIDQTSICLELGLNNPAASKHLGKFETRGLVSTQRSGRSRLYHATGGLHSALQLLSVEAA